MEEQTTQPKLRRDERTESGIRILYEDNHLLVAEKPVNLPVQADSSGDEDLLTLLKEYIRARYEKPGEVYLGFVHRLDRRRLAPAGYALDPIHPSTPHHVPESSELVAKLMDVYNTISGENAKPFAIGGGTYARHLKEGVAYGMLFPGELELEHQANESIDVANFVKAARIYAYAIVALCA